MQLVKYRPGTSAVWADALFASMLQRSDGPSASQVRQTVAAAVHVYGRRWCAERVAQEFGDHPETAVARMRWARGVVGEVLASPPGLAPGGRRRRLDCPLPACADGGWCGHEAHPHRCAEDPARAPLAAGPAGRPTRPRCGPSQGAGPCPAGLRAASARRRPELTERAMTNPMAAAPARLQPRLPSWHHAIVTLRHRSSNARQRLP